MGHLYSTTSLLVQNISKTLDFWDSLSTIEAGLFTKCITFNWPILTCIVVWDSCWYQLAHVAYSLQVSVIERDNFAFCLKVIENLHNIDYILCLYLEWI